MPTGLTAKIYNGENQTFREFALRCATQFSPFYSYGGDLPLDKPPVLKGMDYCERELEQAREELKEAYRLKEHPEEAERMIAEENREIQEWNAQKKIRSAECRIRFDAMIAKVEQWQVTEEYQYLKDFMLKQLKETRDYDCPEDCYQRSLITISPEEWIASKIKYAHENIGYYTEKLAKERKWYKDSNEHIQGFYKLLEHE